MDDSKLRQDVLDELDWQPYIPSAQIAVTADQGVVRLSGYVSTYAEKVAAEQAVKRVVGVRAAVVESLEVRSPTESPIRSPSSCRLPALRLSGLLQYANRNFRRPESCA